MSILFRYGALLVGSDSISITVYDSCAITENITTSVLVSTFSISVHTPITTAENNISSINDLAVISNSVASVAESNIFEFTSFISAYDEISITEYSIVYITTISHISFSIIDVVSVVDVTTATLSDIKAETADEIAITEQSIILNAILNLESYDEVSVAETVTHVFTSFISLYDSISAAEEVEVSNALPGVYAYDAITVEEYIAVTAGDLGVITEDAIILLDTLNIVIEAPAVLYLNISDEIVVVTNAIISFTGGPAAYDFIASSEYVCVSIPVVPVNAFESISVNEEIKFLLSSFITVQDTTTISEYVVSSITTLPLTSIDTISVGEHISIQNILGTILVFDITTLSESSDASCEIAGVSVYSTITITESLPVDVGIPSSWQIFVSDASLVEEAVLLFYPEHKVITNEVVIVTESLEFFGAVITGMLKIYVSTDCLDIKAEAKVLELITEVL